MNFQQHQSVNVLISNCTGNIYLNNKQLCIQYISPLVKHLTTTTSSSPHLCHDSRHWCQHYYHRRYRHRPHQHRLRPHRRHRHYHLHRHFHRHHYHDHHRRHHSHHNLFVLALHNFLDYYCCLESS